MNNSNLAPILFDHLLDVIDYRGKTPPKSEEGIPTLTAKNVKGGRIDLTSVSFVSRETYERWTTRGFPQEGDVLITTEAPVGQVAMFPTDRTYLITRRLIALRPDPQTLDSRYLLYYLLSKPFSTYIDSKVRGSTVPRVLKTDILDHQLPLPDVADQKAIAHILGTLDEKIELNQKMNETLEEIAKAIFKSWFVHFDPVRAKAEGRPTGLPPEISDLFPAELVDSEIGEIPKGWDVGALSDVADITMGQSPPGDTYNDDGVGLPFYQGSTDFGFRFPSLRKYCSEPKRLADADDVLISVRAPVGDMNRAKNACCIGRGLASLRAKDSLRTWVFYRCKFLSRQLETFNSEGTVFGSINGKDLKGLPTILPPEILCKTFDEIGKPMDDGVRNRTSEIEVLTELRDTLLPKLISGELRIPDAEKFLEEAGI